MRRYPLEPLISLTRSRETGLRMSYGELGAIVGVSGAGVQKWSLRGITSNRAERAAVALGFDPYSVWPEMLDDAISDCSKDCEHCKAPFVPSRQSVKYCTPQCRSRAARIRFRATEHGRAYNRMKRREYYEQNRSYELKRQALYDARKRAEVSSSALSGADGTVAA